MLVKILSKNAGGHDIYAIVNASDEDAESWCSKGWAVRAPEPEPDIETRGDWPTPIEPKDDDEG